MTETVHTEPLPASRLRDAADGASPEWWRTAVIYQIYPRSFADGNGDGIGDLAGVRARLPYLVELGVDAIWFTPWYVSPLADGGYDVADYRAIDPAFGTLAEAESLIAEARELGIRTIVDVVPNHLSDSTPGSAPRSSPNREARSASASGSAPVADADGDEPPNQWLSIFGGRAWTRTTDAGGRPGEWYLHLFSPQQPDLNWSHPDVRREFEDVLRFWFDRGVAGVRIDSAALLVKDPGLPELEDEHGPGQHPTVDRDEVHEIYRSWRRIADGYDDERALVGEIWLPTSSASRATCVRTSCTLPSTSTSSRDPGMRPACEPRSTRPWRRTSRSPLRRRGSSRTTTSRVR